MSNLVLSDDTYKFLSERVKEIGVIIKSILELLEDNREYYHEEFLSKLNYSDATFRPAIYSLYSAGFIDKKPKGHMKFYIINQNGLRLLEEIRGGS